MRMDNSFLAYLKNWERNQSFCLVPFCSFRERKQMLRKRKREQDDHKTTNILDYVLTFSHLKLVG